MARADEPSTFDYNDNLFADASRYVAAGLLQFNGRHEPVPDLAHDVQVNAAGDVYRFLLRDDSRWSSGDPITAKDFVFSWTRRLDPSSGADYAAYLHDIKNAVAFNETKTVRAEDLGLRAIDPLTFEVALERPAAYFPSLAAYTGAVPVHRPSLQRWGRSYGTDVQHFVASGPYQLTD